MDTLSAWPCAPSSGVAQGGITALTDRHALKALRHMPELWRVSTVFYYFEKNGCRELSEFIGTGVQNADLLFPEKAVSSLFWTALSWLIHLLLMSVEKVQVVETLGATIIFYFPLVSNSSFIVENVGPVYTD